MMRSWWLPAGLLLALAGYFGPWVDHAAAGLVITGLDLGEYVKFLPTVRSGMVSLWRPGFYAPLAAVSFTAAITAYRPVYWPHPLLRAMPILIALVAAFNLVPPAWTPTRLLEPEFRVQTTTLIFLVIAVACSPFLAMIPQRVAAATITVLALLGLALPLHGFLGVRPAIADLYAQPLGLAWGPWVLAIGLGAIVLAAWMPPARPNESGIRRDESTSQPESILKTDPLHAER